MKTFHFVLSLGGFVAFALLLNGCGTSSNSPPTVTPSGSQAESNDQEEGLESLSKEDQAMVDAQGYCAVTSEPLGSMGTPIKVIVNEQPVFVCCKGCEKRAKSNPTKTLAKIAELKARVKSEKTP